MGNTVASAIQNSKFKIQNFPFASFAFVMYMRSRGALIMKYKLDFSPRSMLRLSMVEQIIRDNRLLVPAPSRPKLIALIEEGRMQGKRTEYGWLVFEDSFLAWIKELQNDTITG